MIGHDGEKVELKKEGDKSHLPINITFNRKSRLK
jgi:hypothetical protein